MRSDWLARALERFGWLTSWPGEGPPPPPDPVVSGELLDEQASVARILEAAIAEHRLHRWQVAEPLFRFVIESRAAWPGERQVARNILGNLLERTRRTDEAIAVYEANLGEGFAGSYPYERLAAIYRKRGQPGDEERVLSQAVAVVERELRAGRTEVGPQLDRLSAALAEARGARRQ